MKPALILICLLVVASLTKGYAQASAYQFSRLDVNRGLSHNQVNSILKDSRGFVWFGTLSGLNRYDGYRFKVYRTVSQDTASISDNYIETMFEGPNRELWVITRNGTNIFDPITEKFNRNAPAYANAEYGLPGGEVRQVLGNRDRDAFYFLHSTGIFQFSVKTKQLEPIANRPGDSSSVSKEIATGIAQDPSGMLWIIYRTGMLERYDPVRKRVVFRINTQSRDEAPRQYSYRISCDREGDPWFFPENATLGIFHLDVSASRIHHFDNRHPETKLNTNIVKGVLEDNKGLIWVATDHGGVNVIDKQDYSVKYIMSSDDDKSISQNSINSIYKDQTGIIWIGTYKKGISYYHENIIRFPVVKSNNSAPHSLPYEDVNCFAEDRQGNLWIGTNGGGLLYYDRASQRYRRYLHNPSDPSSLSNNVIVSMLLDKQGKLWIGTYFGGLNCFDGSRFIRYKHDPANPNSIADDKIYSILEDSRGALWVGTLGGGLDRLERSTGHFTHHRAGSGKSIHSDYISSLLEDRQGNLWIGTAHGVDKFDRKSGKIVYYSSQGTSSRGQLTNDNVGSLYEDSRGWVWIGTREGLNVYDPGLDTFRNLTRLEGLADNMITSIVEDKAGVIWVGSANGLSAISVKTEDSKPAFSFANYDERDGLQGKLFNANAAYRTSRGELLFGGGDGFNIIEPSNIGLNKVVPPVVLTDFQLFNKSIRTGELVNGKMVLPASIAEISEIVLPYSSNFFSIEFAALNYFHPEKNQYQYMLEGLNNEWLTADNDIRRATFTNLDPGSYTFKVRASNNDGIWNEEGVQLSIRILPPFWKTPLAFIIYFAIIVGALLLSRRLILERERMNYRLEQNKQEAQRMHELDVMKIRFFTNISHEFRTPLTLIMAPLEKLVKTTPEPDRQRHLVMIYRNARRLLNLVNQLLDFRRLELDEISLNPSKGEIVSFIRDISYSFSDLSEKKNIHFSFHNSVESLDTWFDHDKIEKILFNLLSNAFKFTSENGEVEVELTAHVDDEEDEVVNFEIKVRDTGIGIPPEKQEKIFERFFQTNMPRSMVNQGSGIGLAITREFVKLHRGHISVESEPERGSTFTVSLPLRKVIHAESINLPIVNPGETSRKTAPHDITGRPVVLLVEDNEDFRFYLKDNLKEHFNILEARNGKEAWKQILQTVPDMVVSDVAMPEMDGLELCRKLRHDPRTRHVPLILLTARSGEEHQLEGLETGANDFITKPFNFELLLSRIRNHVSQKQSIQKTYEKQIPITASNIEVTSVDEKLVQKALAAVEKNMDNAEFSVEELSRELCMSRVALYKKLVSITGKTPIEFIRTVRLKRAAQLLAKSQLTIAEVAYEVGFNNPKYFTKYFKKEFGVIPSQYQSDMRDSTDAKIPNDPVF